MEYFIRWDLDAWIEQGLRAFEDFLLVHAAFRQMFPE